MLNNNSCYIQAAAVIALAVTPCTFAQSAQNLGGKPTVLRESSSTPVNVPKFRARGANQCDQEGSVYSLVKSAGMAHNVVVSIARDGHSKNVYTVDSTLDGEPGTVAFSVASNGAVDLLDQLPDKGTYLQRYDRAGRPVSPIKIVLPSSRLNISHLAVNNSGSFIVSGIYGNEEPGPRKGAPFLAVFDSDGQHYREVTEIEPALLVTAIENSYVEQVLTTGEDGSFYLQVRNRIFVISEDGHVLRRLILGDWPVGSFTDILRISGNRILVGYFTVDEIKARVLHLHLSLHDLTTGAMIATYDPSAISDTFACFDPQKGFTFVKIRQGSMFIVDATLP